MTASRTSIAVAVGLLCVGALGAVAIFLRFSGTAPVAPPGLEGSPDAKAPTGGEPSVYRATIVRTFEKSGASSSATSRVARSGDWTRLEWSESGRSLAEIVRPDRGVAWLVDLDGGVYAERSLVGDPTVAAPGADVDPDRVEQVLAEAGSGAVLSRELLADETVDGHVCAVYRARAEALQGGVTESTVWEARDLGGLALRSESRGPDGSTARTELREVRLDVDPALFEPPTGARRVEALP